MIYSTRRQFLLTSAIGAIAAPQLVSSSAERALGSLDNEMDDVNANSVAILNDVHIDKSHGPDHAHPKNLQLAIKQILALPKRPAAIIINGDLALSTGMPGDYEKFTRLIEPIRNAGLPLHLTLGNHDNRDNFLRAFADFRSVTQFNDHRHNGVVNLPHARLLLLDSLKDTPAAPGRLGEEQIAWLLKEIDTDVKKPTVLMGHHNPRLGGDPIHFPGGIEDTDTFWPELVKRSQVKAYIHGHIHDWTLAMHSGIQIINTLASAMVANKAICTNGWTLASFKRDGVDLQIHTFLHDHPWNNERKWLYWRQLTSVS